MTEVVRRQRVWTSDDGTHGIDAIHTLTETGEEPMTQTDAQAAVMVTAHESWERKRELSNELRRVVAALAENVYTEYATFRGCSWEAAYKEAQDQVQDQLEMAKSRLNSTLYTISTDARERDRERSKR